MQVYNSQSGKREEFVPQGDEVKMYVCGINPYDDAHIGHAFSYCVFDVIRRYLEYRGYKVKHIQNITDIEDNIITQANERGVTVQELTQKYVERYDEDMKVLNIQPAHVYPRAMSEIPKMLEIVSGLIDKGFAYAVGGNVYFRVRSVPDYGKLSHRNLDEMMAGARVDPGEEKEHPMDFLLWKEAKPGEPSWDSPWGKGRPGWHIECSAMSIRYLGETIDIHGGGQDVVFPHHENEIAQSESFTGKKPFAKYWIHNGLLSIGGEKGSRSLGNMITIREALMKYSADAIRVFTLGAYYRSPLSFLSDSLEVAERGADRLRLAAAAQEKGEKGSAEIDIESYRNKFIEVMDDDFGTPQALATLFDLARDINRSSDEGYDVTQAQEVFTELAGVLGLTLSPREPTRYTRTLVTNIATSSKVLAESIDPISVGNNINILQARDEVITASGNLLAQIDIFLPRDEEFVDGVIEIESSMNNTVETVKELRQVLRENKLYNEADNIRNSYENQAGVQFEDTAEGTTWKLKR